MNYRSVSLRTRYIAVSVYDPSNTSITYVKYKELFNKGLKVLLNPTKAKKKLSGYVECTYEYAAKG